VEVEGLLGQFDHHIYFPESWEFVILHGPNGVGKTKLLELIRAVSMGGMHLLHTMPFQSASLGFDDGQKLHIKQSVQMNGVESDIEFATDEESSRKTVITWSAPGEDAVEWAAPDVFDETSPRLTRAIAQEHPSLIRSGTRRWRDRRTGEYLVIEEILDRFPELLRFADFEAGVPAAIQSRLFDHFDVHLIETQRLIRMETDDPRAGPRDVPARRATVSEHSKDLIRRLGVALAQNSRTSQDLDRSFPRRLLSPKRLSPEISDDVIRARYMEQNALRTSLAEISVLDTGQEIPLPERALESWERRVLWTYLEDSESKLATFQTILERVKLLRQIVNSRFLFKELNIDQERGFTFVTTSGREISVEQLSSGEQHELVLAYELLFNVRPGSLVLIDEPEISLHVVWQQEFLNDIKRIADVAGLRFIVATHSPQIIHKWWDRTVTLAPGEARDWAGN